MEQRYKYTREQLEQYFDRICLPRARRIFDISSLPDDQILTYLTLLHKHQLVKVPWENLTQHYSWHRVVNVKPQHLFNKIVRGTQGSGRGGYCMEANSFFFTVLLSLGFDVYQAGARIYGGEGKYGGWTHTVNLVTVGGTKYVLDGGFGPQEAPRPLPLRHSEVATHIAPAQIRVVYEALPQHLDRTQKVWVYQYRYDEGKEWQTMYCFTELEFLPSDIESMNFSPWLNKQSFFTHKVVAVRFTTSKEQAPSSDENGGKPAVGGPGSPTEEALEGELDGSITINQDVLKWRRGGQEKVLEWKFGDEGERLEALEKYFGILLSEEDREAIKGTASAIGGGAMGQDN